MAVGFKENVLEREEKQCEEALARRRLYFHERGEAAESFDGRRLWEHVPVVCILFEVQCPKLDYLQRQNSDDNYWASVSDFLDQWSIVLLDEKHPTTQDAAWRMWIRMIGSCEDTDFSLIVRALGYQPDNASSASAFLQRWSVAVTKKHK